MEPKLTIKYIADDFRHSPTTIFYKLENIGINKKIEGRSSYITHSDARILYKDRLKESNLKIFSFHTFKGGVGKTTCSREIGIRLSSLGLRTLLVDGDPQGNLSSSLNINIYDKNLLFFDDLLLNKCQVEQTILSIGNGLDLIPSNENLFFIEDELAKLDNLATHLEPIFNPIADKYDVIIFDTPPSNTRVLATINSYTDTIVIPVEPDDFSIEGLKNVIKRIQQMDKNLNSTTKIKILINKYDGRRKESEQLMNSLFGSSSTVQLTIKSYIRVDEKILSARKNKKSIFESSNQTRIKACEDFDLIVRELMGY